MEYLGAWVFLALIYGLCGFVSKKLFEGWCDILFDDAEVIDAASSLMAIVWPVGWALVGVVGVCCILLAVFRQVIWSIKVLVKHFRQAERGEQ